MPLVEFKCQPSNREIQTFAVLWLPAACFGLALWATVRHHNVLGVLMAAMGLAIASLGIVRPRSLRPLYVAWMAAAFPPSWLVAHLFLAMIYILLITPLGLILRLARRDPLARRFDREAQSYWKPRAPNPDRERFFRQY